MSEKTIKVRRVKESDLLVMMEEVINQKVAEKVEAEKQQWIAEQATNGKDTISEDIKAIVVAAVKSEMKAIRESRK